MEEQKQITGYELSRKWFDFCFDNPEKIKPIHTAIFMFAMEHNNRLGWREKFGFPSEMAMSAIGVKNWRTYTKALNELEDFGFIVFLEKSKNQYSANIISLFACVKNTIATTKALDKAMQKHSTKQSRSTVSIDKPLNNEQLNKKPKKIKKDNKLLEETFNFFWKMYPNKKSKVVAKKLWNKLKMTEELYRKIIYSLQEQMNSKQWTKKDGEFIPHPSTWLNQERWNDEEVTPPKDLELENFFNSMK